jgi:hypothetical protein
MPWLQQTRLRPESFKHFHILAPAFCRVVQSCYRLLTWRHFHKYAQAQSSLSDFSLTKPNSLITISMRDSRLYVILTMCYNQLLPTHEQAVLKYPILCGPSIQKIFVYFNLHFFREKILHLIIWLKLVHVMKHSALTVYIVTRSQLGLYTKYVVHRSRTGVPGATYGSKPFITRPAILFLNLFIVNKSYSLFALKIWKKSLFLHCLLLYVQAPHMLHT